MKRHLILFLFSITVVSFFATTSSNGQNVKNISVELELSSTESQTGNVSSTLIIKNNGAVEVKTAHPNNRMAVAFIVMNSLGNVVSPVGLAKIDPAFREVTIRPNSEYRHSFPKLEFLTGSALFGFQLNQGETYRIVAIYCPNGEKSVGVASDEQFITVR